MRLRAVLVTSVMLAGAAQPALACTPVTVIPAFATELSAEDFATFLAAYEQAWNTPDARAARNYSHQEQMWREADSVVLVRITAFSVPDPQLSARELRQLGAALPTKTLEPVRWLKGEGQSTPFRVRPRGGGDCSVAAGWDASSAMVGDVFVAYFAAGPLSDDTLLDGLAPEQVVEATVRGLLALQQ
jgi:hypothetical protein